MSLEGCALSPAQGCPPMKSQDKELWQQLCKQAANEQDPTKLMGLANEICRLLDEKFERTERKLRPIARHNVL